MKTNTKLLQVANLVAFAATIVVNTLASTVGLFGAQTGALSDGIRNLFVPSGLTFSVWGVIYLLLLGFTVAQARGLFSADRQAPEPLARAAPRLLLHAERLALNHPADGRPLAWQGDAPF